MRERLYYQPPYDWQRLHDFLAPRLIPGLEWLSETTYGRSCVLDDGTLAWFNAQHRPEQNGFDVTLFPTDLLPENRPELISRVRRILDLDSDPTAVSERLQPLVAPFGGSVAGQRIPCTGSVFESGVRAILGQQVSIGMAHRLIRQLLAAYGAPVEGESAQVLRFPQPEDLAESPLDPLRLPGQRKAAISQLAGHFLISPETAADPDTWLTIKGIGPWSVRYARMRGLGDPDVWLGSDLGVRRILARHGAELDPEQARPYRSYLTLSLWALS